LKNKKVDFLGHSVYNDMILRAVCWYTKSN